MTTSSTLWVERGGEKKKKKKKKPTNSATQSSEHERTMNMTTAAKTTNTKQRIIVAYSFRIHQKRLHARDFKHLGDVRVHRGDDPLHRGCFAILRHACPVNTTNRAIKLLSVGWKRGDALV